MMGDRVVMQESLLYQFRLDDHVPADHMLRAIDRFVDLAGLRQHLASFYSSTGRPSIDPELLVRMLLVGYCYGIRSERRLCEEVHLNLAYRWFCRLGLDGEVPDHSTFSKNRHGRFRDCDLLRKLFETVVRRCMAEGLVDGTAFAVDASLIAADANKQRSSAGSDDVDWEAIARTRRSVREYLDTLDEAAWGAASETVPKFISRSDPAAQWTGAHKGHAFFAYADNYLIDLKVAIIVDVEATRAIRQAEVGAARTMIERTEDCLGLCPERLAADSAYGSAEMLGCIEGRDRYKRMTLATDEFIRRFLIHVLPKGFHRIRHYGLFAKNACADNIAHARQLLAVAKPNGQPTAAAVDPSKPACPCCGGRMIVIEVFERGATPRHRPTAPTTVIRLDT